MDGMDGNEMEMLAAFPNGGGWRGHGLLGPHIRQTSDLCWAISLTRQFGHLLRFRQIIPPDQQLSIQQMVNKTPRRFLELEGEIRDIDVACSVLKVNGSIRAEDMPFTQRPNSHIYFDDEGKPQVYHPTYVPKSVKVHWVEEYYHGYGGVAEGTAVFYDLIRQKIVANPVSARIPIYPSYDFILGKQIYSPTEDELLEGTDYYHYGLLVDHGEDEETGHPFFEMQDSQGDDFADGGFLRVSALGYLISLFVEISL